MPYKSEKIPIAGSRFDKRRKLSDDQVRAIRILAREGYSQCRLAEMMNCSQPLISQIVNPARRKRSKSKYSTARNTEAKRRYRARKEALYKSGAFDKKKHDR